MQWVKETGVPMPKPSRGTGGFRTGKRSPLMQALFDLNVGENLFLPDAESNAANGQIVALKKNHGMIYQSRLMADGLRIWRVE